MSERDDEGCELDRKKDLTRLVKVTEDHVIEAIFEQDVSLGTSVISGVLARAGKPISDEAFSHGLTADLDEAVEYCIEVLINDGFFSFEADYWIVGQNFVKFDQIFDSHGGVSQNQLQLRKWVEEKQSAQNQFADSYEFIPVVENTHIIFGEIERSLCRNGKLFLPNWYAARILREYTSDSTDRSEFLIGILWEQLRQKLTHGDDVVKRQKQISQLRSQQSEATDAIVRRSNSWKVHCETVARKMLDEDPKKYGNWSELAGQILAIVEQMPNQSEVRRSYLGKRSKNKPRGSDLIDQSTVARFLSNCLKT